MYKVWNDIILHIVLSKYPMIDYFQLHISCHYLFHYAPQIICMVIFIVQLKSIPQLLEG